MFNQVSANIAAQKQAGLFEEGPEEFALVSQDKKGHDVAAAPVDPLAAYWAGSCSASVARKAGAAIEELFPFGYRSSKSAP